MPVFDAHMHWGSMVLGEAYDRAYDTREAVERLKAAGVAGVVNLDGGMLDWAAAGRAMVSENGQDPQVV